ncbi:alkaline ceramidase 3-like isoform X2 [Acanthaster planci]|nr:alkaline ceramidase 3-like isoform X2 [Acanthaster planci]
MRSASKMAPSAAEFASAWGQPTSTLDWCEENYLASPYIAELWNSLSSVVIIGIPIISLLSFSLWNVEKRFFVACWCFLAVGISSLAFHMTLLYETQLMDELSMIWGGCVLVYLFFSHDSKPNSNSLPLVAFLLLYALCVTLIYLLTKEPVFHQVAFSLQVITVMLRGIQRKYSYSGSLRLLFFSLVLYSVGFVLWLTDTAFCLHLRSIRAFLPTPVGVVLQFHAWWHTLSSLGTHCLFVA